MSKNLVTVPSRTPIKDLVLQYFVSSDGRKHQGYPVLDDDGRLLGVVTKSDLLDEWVAGLLNGATDHTASSPIITFDLVGRPPITIFPHETCRIAAERMAALGVGRLLVVSPQDSCKLLGILTRSDVLKSRSRHVEEEMQRERFLGRKNQKVQTNAD